MKNYSVKPKNDILKLSITLFLIAAIMALLVSLVNNVTTPEIERRNSEKITKALGTVLPDADEFDKIDYNTSSVLSSDGKTVDIDGVWSVKSNRVFVGYCVKVSPNGYGGAIETIVAISPEGEVTGTQIVSMSETSGIGTKIQNDVFLSQFNGIKSSDISGVEVISGATKSSSAYIRGIEAALKVALEVNGGEWNA